MRVAKQSCKDPREGCPVGCLKDPAGPLRLTSAVPRDLVLRLEDRVNCDPAWSEMTSILRSPKALQLTLALIKPDAVAHPLILEAVHQQILSNKFLIVRMRELLWRKEDCQKFYKEHEGRFFYQRLVEFMASGPIRAYILAHKDAIQLWRTLMGPTRVFRARHMAPDSIRGSFGLTDTRNTTHGSDSVVSASREIAAFFPDFSEQRWYEEEEPQLRCGPVCYTEGGIHCAVGTGGPGPA
ncbi:nucleoside diphosphate kinase 6 isoform X2 [Ictidomys tridecemlineatus]|nr:nucleoside diphosphate kinase 6 isoform X1 [Ictidomys tridecemlineatus]